MYWFGALGHSFGSQTQPIALCDKVVKCGTAISTPSSPAIDRIKPWVCRSGTVGHPTLLLWDHGPTISVEFVRHIQHPQEHRPQPVSVEQGVHATTPKPGVRILNGMTELGRLNFQRTA
jgi:hypothetical protein